MLKQKTQSRSALSIIHRKRAGTTEGRGSGHMIQAASGILNIPVAPARIHHEAISLIRKLNILLILKSNVLKLLSLFVVTILTLSQQTKKSFRIEESA